MRHIKLPMTFDLGYGVRLTKAQVDEIKSEVARVEDIVKTNIFEAIKKLCMDNNMVELAFVEFADYNQNADLVKRVAFLDNKNDAIYSQACMFDLNRGEQLSGGMTRGVSHHRITNIQSLEQAVMEIINGEKND